MMSKTMTISGIGIILLNLALLFILAGGISLWKNFKKQPGDENKRSLFKPFLYFGLMSFLGLILFRASQHLVIEISGNEVVPAMGIYSGPAPHQVNQNQHYEITYPYQGSVQRIVYENNGHASDPPTKPKWVELAVAFVIGLITIWGIVKLLKKIYPSGGIVFVLMAFGALGLVLLFPLLYVKLDSRYTVNHAYTQQSATMPQTPEIVEAPSIPVSEQVEGISPLPQVTVKQKTTAEVFQETVADNLEGNTETFEEKVDNFVDQVEKQAEKIANTFEDSVEKAQEEVEKNIRKAEKKKEQLANKANRKKEELTQKAKAIKEKAEAIANKGSSKDNTKDDPTVQVIKAEVPSSRLPSNKTESNSENLPEWTQFEEPVLRKDNSFLVKSEQFATPEEALADAFNKAGVAIQEHHYFPPERAHFFDPSMIMISRMHTENIIRKVDDHEFKVYRVYLASQLNQAAVERKVQILAQARINNRVLLLSEILGGVFIILLIAVTISSSKLKKHQQFKPENS